MGSFVAERLARKGVEVLLLDRSQGEVPPICTGIVGVEIDRLIPVPRETVFSRVSSVRLNVAGQRELDYSQESTIAYVIDRLRFDELMLQDAIDAGVQCMRPARLVDVVFQEPDDLTIKVDTADGVVTLCTNLLILATGFSPGLLNRLGLPGYPGTMEGAQVEMPLITDGRTIDVYFGNNLVPKGFLWVVPMGEEMARVGLVTPGDSVRILKGVLANGIPGRVPRGSQAGSIRMRLLPRGPIPRSCGDGLLVVGEAAGQMKATTYGGIYYGLLCGECAVQTALTALDLNNSSSEVLKGYESLWRERIGEELSQGARWRSLFESMSDEQMVIAADIIGGDGIFNKIKGVVKFDWHRDIIGLGLAYLKRHGMGVVSSSLPGGDS